MNKKAIEEYSEAVRTALKALPLSQRMAMHDERVGDYPSDGKTLIESLDEVICDNAACGTEVAFQELYDLIEMLAHKPVKPITLTLTERQARKLLRALEQHWSQLEWDEEALPDEVHDVMSALESLGLEREIEV